MIKGSPTARCALNVLNHDMEAKKQPMRSGAMPQRSAFKSFNELNDPVYTMVICKHSQVKAVTDVCSVILDQKGKNDGY